MVNVSTILSYEDAFNQAKNRLRKLGDEMVMSDIIKPTNNRRVRSNFSDHIRFLAGYIASADVMRSCLNCEWFDEPNEMCKVFKQRPPARVIVEGCNSYSDKEDLPF